MLDIIQTTPELSDLSAALSVGRCRLTALKPVLKVPRLSALETRISFNAFNGCFQLRRYMSDSPPDVRQALADADRNGSFFAVTNAGVDSILAWVGRCRLTVSKPVFKAPIVSALETTISETAFKVCFQFQLAPLYLGRLPGQRQSEGHQGDARRRRPRAANHRVLSPSHRHDRLRAAADRGEAREGHHQGHRLRGRGAAVQVDSIKSHVESAYGFSACR